MDEKDKYKTCWKCNGKGYISHCSHIQKLSENHLFFKDGKWTYICKKCNGKGKIKWIEDLLK